MAVWVQVVGIIILWGIVLQAPWNVEPHALPAGWWFIGLLAFLAPSFMVWWYYHRVARLKEIERTRLRIARDLHDEVGSSLSSIALTAELLQKELSANELVMRQLARVHATAQKLSRNLNEIVWAIDPHKDKLGDLLLQMKETADEMLGQRSLTYTINFPPEELPQSFKMDFRRNLFLIYKEILHNVVKHAAATKVEITLAISNGMLRLCVTDNGRGFCTHTVRNGSGLKSMHGRAHELHGRLEIRSQPEHGTMVVLWVRV